MLKIFQVSTIRDRKAFLSGAKFYFSTPHTQSAQWSSLEAQSVRRHEWLDDVEQDEVVESDDEAGDRVHGATDEKETDVVDSDDEDDDDDKDDDEEDDLSDLEGELWVKVGAFRFLEARLTLINSWHFSIRLVVRSAPSAIRMMSAIESRTNSCRSLIPIWSS